MLAFATNWVAATLALATLALYLFVYTPMKRTLDLSTLVGAVPGALPAVIGWAAARGDIAIGGWTLFAIVFLWQIPHFMAIAWMYRDDYRSAGFPMLPVVEPDGLRTGQQALLYAAALLPVSIGPTVVGIAGWVYFWLALVLGVGAAGAGRPVRARAHRSVGTHAVLRVDHLPAAHLGRHGARPLGSDVGPRSAGGQRLAECALRHPAAGRLHPDPLGRGAISTAGG